ncbi:hypothetical protein WJ542_26250 [Paraburkholderia sp. B3]|uniref:hypothetical protein n=1 Tax=Paraburkholderia sp. B3 TaxID=3134791 RepID=UPI0039822DAD
MSLADKVERRLLGTARILCIVALVAAVMGMIAVVFALAAPAGTGVIADPPVAASDVLGTIPGTEAANDALSNGAAPTLDVAGAAGLVVPAALRAVLNQDDASQTVLDGWLGSVPPPDRQPFLDELSDVIARASQHAATWEWDDRERYVAAAMSQYAHMKIERVTLAANAIEAENNRSGQFRSSLGILLALAGFLTVLILLMAIERNTRSLRGQRQG